MTSAEAYRRYLEKTRVASSDLFESGSLDTEPTNETFLRRLNTVTARRLPSMDKKIPATFPDAIGNDGTVSRHAELVGFGCWLLLDGQPGMKASRGNRPIRRSCCSTSPRCWFNRA